MNVIKIIEPQVTTFCPNEPLSLNLYPYLSLSVSLCLNGRLFMFLCFHDCYAKNPTRPQTPRLPIPLTLVPLPSLALVLHLHIFFSHGKNSSQISPPFSFNFLFTEPFSSRELITKPMLLLTFIS